MQTAKPSHGLRARTLRIIPLLIMALAAFTLAWGVVSSQGEPLAEEGGAGGGVEELRR